MSDELRDGVYGPKTKAAIYEMSTDELKSFEYVIDMDGNVKAQIVRCCKCRHYRGNVWTMGAKRGINYTCERERKQVSVEPDGFCAWGERER